MEDGGGTIISGLASEFSREKRRLMPRVSQKVKGNLAMVLDGSLLLGMFAKVFIGKNLDGVMGLCGGVFKKTRSARKFSVNSSGTPGNFFVCAYSARVVLRSRSS